MSAAIAGTPFRDLSSATIDREIADEAENVLLQRLLESGPGNCLRVSTLPLQVMEDVAQRLNRMELDAHVRLLVAEGAGTDPMKPWQVKATQLVALRNAEDKPLLVFIPLGLRTSAEDSFDVSTFAEVQFSALSRTLRGTLVRQLPVDLQPLVQHLLDQLEQSDLRPSDEQVVRFLLTIRENGSTAEATGRALYQLRIIPDLLIVQGTDREEMARRISRNVKAVQSLADGNENLVSRIYRLGLEPGSIQVELNRFLSQFVPEDIISWGRAIAVESEYQGLSFDNWAFVTATAECLLYVQELKLPVRQDIEGSVKVLNPKSLDARSGLSISWETSPEPKHISQLDHFHIELVNSSGVIINSWRASIKNSKRQSFKIKDIPDLGLQEDLYFFRVQARNAEDVTINKEDRREPGVSRNPLDPDSKRINETEELLYTEEDVPPPPITDVRTPTVSSFLEARFNAQFQALDQEGAALNVRALKPEKAAWTRTVAGGSGSGADIFNIRYNLKSSYNLLLSGTLVDIERRTLAGEDPLGRWRLDLFMRPDSQTPSIENRTTHRETSAVPDSFRDARQRVFSAITAVPEQSEIDDVSTAQIDQSATTMISATIDLLPIAHHIEQYLEAYIQWLNSLAEQLSRATQVEEREELLFQTELALELDTVYTRAPQGADSVVTVLLLGPGHPLRLWWHLQWQRLADDWMRRALSADRPKELLTESARSLLRALAPRHQPQFLMDSHGHFYTDSGPLTLFWQLYMPPGQADSHAVRDAISQRLGLKQTVSAASSITSNELLAKLSRYMLQHPYISTLKLNVFNPGDASVVVNAIVGLQQFRPDLKYQVSLFSRGAALDDVGEAFEMLLSPNRQVSEAQDEFAAASRNHLFPKLRFARNQLDEFLATPERFPAHISLLLNLFPVEIGLQTAVSRGRSSYVHGLIQEPVTWFVGEGHIFSWHHQVAPAQCAELPLAAGATGRLADGLRLIANLQAVVAEGRYRSDTRPTAQLNLDLNGKSLIYQIHEVSDWVLIVDSNLGLEYFDAAPQPERPIYLLDFTPQYLAAAGERMLLTTRSTEEILSIIGPALQRYSINEGDGQELLFLHMLRSLSGRLALQLLSAPNHADEAISLALTRMFLEQYELLSSRLIIPLDAHKDLFTQPKEAPADLFDAALTAQRSDLLMVEVEPDQRTLVFHLLEVKSRRHGAASGLEYAMEEQLSNAQRVLQLHFDPLLQQPDRLDRSFKTKELVGLLLFYLERAKSYHSVDDNVADRLLEFIVTLDQGYTLRFARAGIIFDLTAGGLKETRSAEDTTFFYVGSNYIERIVQNSLRDMAGLTTTSAKQRRLVRAEKRQSSVAPMRRDPTFERVRDKLTTTGFSAQVLAAQTPANPSTPAEELLPQTNPEADAQVPGADQEPVTPEPEPDIISTASEYQLPRTDPRVSDSSAQERGKLPMPDAEALIPPEAETGEHLAPLVEVLLGDTRLTQQYGVLGAGGGKVVGIDLNGVNTISLFGVQGAGKSYTIGTIVEMATERLPHLNLLPHKLATVIFHYHESQEYPPEFVSMIKPNQREDEIQRLRDEFEAAPKALSDVVLLTSVDTLEARRREFPSLQVHPIHFRSDELTARDWLFLMGAVGNQSMYIAQMSKIMRGCREDLTLDNIRAGVANSRLTDAQKGFAEMRLDLAAEFIDDEDEPLAAKLRPGRLIIVDLRDELIRSEQALGLFVVMLRIFANVGSTEGARYNKLIVFDEAHKYMEGGDLTDQVVSVVRQMRHQGVSLVIASQDPPSLPNAVIELSSIVILHRFNSPHWLKHIQKSVIALQDLTPAQLSLLKPGEAYVWSSKATEPVFSHKAVKIRLRPRATQHGGETRTAEYE